MENSSIPASSKYKSTLQLVGTTPERWKIIGLMTRQQVADELGCSTKLLRGWCEEAAIKLPNKKALTPKLALKILREFGTSEYE